MLKLTGLLTLFIMLAGVSTDIAFQPEPGQGGAIIEGIVFSDEFSLNPLRCTGDDCLIAHMLFPALIGVDPDTGYYAPMGYGGVASEWRVSEGGLTYTITLRDDLTWNDGTPITAYDAKFSYDAIASYRLDTNLDWLIDDSDSGIQTMDVLDDYTLKITTFGDSCGVLGNLAEFYLLPQHVFGDNFDFADMEGHYYDSQPDVTYGPFQLDSAIPGEKIILVADRNYVEDVIPEAYIFINVADETTKVESFLNGDINFVRLNDENRFYADIRGMADAQYFDFAGLSWDYMALNLADPERPNSGRDEDGEIIDQGHHPIFGDVRVRRAVQHSLDIDAMIEAAVAGEGTVMPSLSIAGSWEYNDDLEPVPYDLETTKTLLEEAGWVDSNGDGIRECHGCLYAAEGTLLEFSLLTNAGNTRRASVGEMVKEQLAVTGFQVNFNMVDFSYLLESADEQTYDAFIMGWRNHFPAEPYVDSFISQNDDPTGYGFNWTSYFNIEAEGMMERAQSASYTGCEMEERARIYRQIQVLLQKDQPYIWLYARNNIYAASSAIQGFAPYPHMPLWNVHTWYIGNN